MRCLLKMTLKWVQNTGVGVHTGGEETERTWTAYQPCHSGTETATCNSSLELWWFLRKCGGLVVSVPASRLPVQGSTLCPGPPQSAVWRAGDRTVSQSCICYSAEVADGGSGSFKVKPDLFMSNRTFFNVKPDLFYVKPNLLLSQTGPFNVKLDLFMSYQEFSSSNPNPTNVKSYLSFDTKEFSVSFLFNFI